LAIVGLVSLHGFAAVTTSLALGGAMALGVALVFIPLAEIDTPTRNGVITAVPVIGGFVLALHPLWADGTIYGVLSSVVITAHGGRPELGRSRRGRPGSPAAGGFRDLDPARRGPAPAKPAGGHQGRGREVRAPVRPLAAQPGSAGADAPEIRISGHDEPRDPNSVERCHRNDGSADGYPAHIRAEGVRGDDPRLGRRAA